MDHAKLYSTIRRKLQQLRDEMRRVSMAGTLAAEDMILDSMTTQLVDAILAEPTEPPNAQQHPG